MRKEAKLKCADDSIKDKKEETGVSDCRLHFCKVRMLGLDSEWKGAREEHRDKKWGTLKHF